MREYKKAKAIVVCTGDYVAWHEMGITVDYVFGTYYEPSETFEDEETNFMKTELELSESDIEKAWQGSQILSEVDKIKLDNYMKRLVISYERDYVDVELKEVLLEIDNNKILNKYLLT